MVILYIWLILVSRIAWTTKRLSLIIITNIKRLDVAVRLHLVTISKSYISAKLSHFRFKGDIFDD